MSDEVAGQGVDTNGDEPGAARWCSVARAESEEPPVHLANASLSSHFGDELGRSRPKIVRAAHRIAIAMRATRSGPAVHSLQQFKEDR